MTISKKYGTAVHFNLFQSIISGVSGSSGSCKSFAPHSEQHPLTRAIRQKGIAPHSGQ